MRYTFINQNEAMADIVIEILQSENIKYKIESKKIGWHDENYIYDITFEASTEYVLFIMKLVNERTEPYVKAEKSFMLPDCVPNHEVKSIICPSIPIMTINDIERQIKDFPGIADVQVFAIPKQKKSLLKKLIDCYWNWRSK